jgi:putative ABC transport system ATP-binding protein
MAVELLATLPTQPMARLQDVFKIYREGTTETVALRGADLELPRGQVTSLVGPSGSGKSTLVSLLAGLTLPSAGQVLIGDRDISRMDETARARLRAERVGLVFQSGNLIPFLSALENVQMSAVLADRKVGAGRARELLAQVGLAKRLHHLPRQLSGGEAQRVAIAVSLINDPELLLADELTGELDSHTAGQVMGLLHKVWEERGLTMLLVTHNRELAAQAHHRLTLIDGIVRAA